MSFEDINKNQVDGGGDAADALACFWKPKEDKKSEKTITDRIEITEGVRLKVSPNISPYLQRYSMSRPNRGKCVIFNNECFDKHTKLKSRPGTNMDVKNLDFVFRGLDFEVQVHQDFKWKDILKAIESEAEKDHTDNDCFACCVLTHGEEGILYGRDGKFAAYKLFTPFRGDSCTSLVGKPKLFFIQACQGEKFDEGVAVKVTESADSVASCKLPTEADFLIAYSTVSGYFSWRNETHGSWFIQELCSVISQCYESTDLLDMMTIVTNNVSLKYESDVPDKPERSGMKQVPCTKSTLRKKLYFTSKSYDSN